MPYVWARERLKGIRVGLGLSAVAILAAVCGLIDPAAGALLQEGIDVLVILNALRVVRIVFLACYLTRYRSQ